MKYKVGQIVRIQGYTGLAKKLNGTLVKTTKVSLNRVYHSGSKKNFGEKPAFDNGSRVGLASQIIQEASA